jgi:hypothetical protein
VLDDEARIAGQEAAHVAGDALGIEARAAARREPHHDVDLFALVEVGDCVLCDGRER